MKIKNVQLQPALAGVRALQKERLPTMTGVKLRRLARELVQATVDLEEERLATLKRHARTDEAGELELDENNNGIFDSDEDRKAFADDVEGLYEGETEITQTLVPSDLIRKERGEDGKVFEMDDWPGVVIEQLGELLVTEDNTPESEE